MNIFVLNAGSSTYKGSIYKIDKSPLSHATTPIWKGLLDYSYSSTEISINVSSQTGSNVEHKFPKKDLSESVKALVQTSWSGSTQVLNDPSEIDFVGHRIVHGGDKFLKPTIITEEVKNRLRELFPLAPLHNPANLKGIEILQALFPDVPHLGVFDTAFHQYMPEFALTYAIPYKFKEEGIRRYGFHGISHEYCAKRAAELSKKKLHELKILSCHLGNGSSLAAVRNGNSLDTTMGFTPLEGLMMGTRCGSLDAGILLYLLRENKLDFKQLDRFLNYESGLQGICGSSDMREVMQKRKQGNALALLAFDMLVHSLVKNIGAMIGVLGGIDVLAFTGGVGENQPELREKVCTYFAYAGIFLDKDKNKNFPLDQEISSLSSQVKIFVIESKEDLAIAQACYKYIN